MGLNVLSLFDGMSCGRIALERAGVEVNNYYASEIDKHAIKVALHNYPDTVQLGDVTKWKEWDLPKIDLLIGGSPCQSISNIGDRTGLDGKSSLFFSYLDCLNHFKPKYFLLENVKGNKKAIQTITDEMGVEPIEINSNLVSGQSRRRLYWTNIQVSPLEDKGIDLKDILEEGVPEASVLSKGRMNWITGEKGQKCVKMGMAAIDPIKANCLTARSDASWNSNYVTRERVLTKLTPIEYERLQTVPDNYTDSVASSHRYKMLGNGWTVDVIAHILKGLK